MCRFQGFMSAMAENGIGKITKNTSRRSTIAKE
jgi:hypothetical protein